MNIEPNNLELGDRATEAMNRAGVAVQACASLALTAAAVVLYLPVAALLIVRNWIDAGCTYPAWLLPKWPFTRRNDADAK